MKVHHRRYDMGGLVRFRFSVRISGPVSIPGKSRGRYFIEVWTRRRHLTIITKDSA